MLSPIIIRSLLVFTAVLLLIQCNLGAAAPIRRLRLVSRAPTESQPAVRYAGQQPHSDWAVERHAETERRWQPDVDAQETETEAAKERRASVAEGSPETVAKRSFLIRRTLPGAPLTRSQTDPAHGTHSGSGLGPHTHGGSSVSRSRIPALVPGDRKLRLPEQPGPSHTRRPSPALHPGAPLKRSDAVRRRQGRTGDPDRTASHGQASTSTSQMGDQHQTDSDFETYGSAWRTAKPASTGKEASQDQTGKKYKAYSPSSKDTSQIASHQHTDSRDTGLSEADVYSIEHGRNGERLKGGGQSPTG